MSWLSNIFGGGKNPADAANQYLNQIPGAMSPYFNPYIGAGQGALNTLQGQYGNLLNNTGDVYNKLAGGYKESPGYQFALKQALGAGQNEAAAGGMLGTPADVQQQQGIATGMANQDFGNYMQNQMGLYSQGLQGTQGLNQMGWDASKSFAENLANVLGQQAQYGYAGQAGKNANQSGMLNNIFGLFGAGLPYMFKPKQ